MRISVYSFIISAILLTASCSSINKKCKDITFGELSKDVQDTLQCVSQKGNRGGVLFLEKKRQEINKIQNKSILLTTSSSIQTRKSLYRLDTTQLFINKHRVQ